MQIPEIYHQIFWPQSLGTGPGMSLFISHSRICWWCDLLTQCERYCNRLCALLRITHVFFHSIIFHYFIFPPIFLATRPMTGVSHVLNNIFHWMKFSWNLQCSGEGYTWDHNVICHGLETRVLSHKRTFNHDSFISEALSGQILK